MADPPRRRRFPPGQEPAPDDGIKAYALQVKRAYVQGRTRHGRLRFGPDYRYKPPAKYDGSPGAELEDGVKLEAPTPSHWEWLARRLRPLDVNLDEYMEVQFGTIGIDAVPPEPKQMASDAALKRWEKFRGDYGEELAVSLESQKSLARGRAYGLQRFARKSYEDAHAIVLCDEGLDLTPLFRYCVASAIGGPRFLAIADSFADEAVSQYHPFRDHYLQRWSAILPKGFDAWARSRHRTMFGDSHG